MVKYNGEVKNTVSIILRIMEFMMHHPLELINGVLHKRSIAYLQNDNVAKVHVFHRSNETVFFAHFHQQYNPIGNFFLHAYVCVSAT